MIIEWSYWLKNEDCSPEFCGRRPRRRSRRGVGERGDGVGLLRFLAARALRNCGGRRVAAFGVDVGVYGLFCLLNIFELALVPTTFLNLGLIEVVEDFVEQQRRAEDERQGRAEDDTPYAVDAPQ